MTQSNATPEEFEKLAFESFISPAFGLVFSAPKSWRQIDDAQYFQVIDPVTGAEFTASAYANNGIFLEQWATL